MARTEAICATCHSHLGHVFEGEDPHRSALLRQLHLTPTSPEGVIDAGSAARIVEVDYDSKPDVLCRYRFKFAIVPFARHTFRARPTRLSAFQTGVIRVLDVQHATGPRRDPTR